MSGQPLPTAVKLIPLIMGTIFVVAFSLHLLLSRRAIRNWAEARGLVKFRFAIGSFHISPKFGQPSRNDALYRFSAEDSNGNPIDGWVRCHFKRNSWKVDRIESTLDEDRSMK